MNTLRAKLRRKLRSTKSVTTIITTIGSRFRKASVNLQEPEWDCSNSNMLAQTCIWDREEMNQDQGNENQQPDKTSRYFCLISRSKYASKNIHLPSRSRTEVTVWSEYLFSGATDSRAVFQSCLYRLGILEWPIMVCLRGSSMLEGGTWQFLLPTPVAGEFGVRQNWPLQKSGLFVTFRLRFGHFQPYGCGPLCKRPWKALHNIDSSRLWWGCCSEHGLMLLNVADTYFHYSSWSIQLLLGVFNRWRSRFC